MQTTFLDSEGLDDLDLAPLHEVCGQVRVYPTSHPDQVPAGSWPTDTFQVT